MTSEATFRSIVVISLLTMVIITMYHRIRAGQSGEKLDRRQEGIFILATLRPVALIVWVAIIAYMINPDSMAWASMPLPGWLRWSGAALFVPALVLLVWTLHSLGRNLTDTVVTRRAHTLVTRGPYGFLRHPFYLTVALMLLATALSAANWFIFVGGSIVVLLLGIRTRTEERNLIARFGDTYRLYMRRTGRFLPRLRAR